MLSQLYKAFYGRWAPSAASPRPGYTLWMFLPGDLPFFFDIFLGVFAGKKADHLVETIVVPDRSSPALRRGSIASPRPGRTARSGWSSFGRLTGSWSGR